MPPYRARVGGMFGSGYVPRVVNRIDVGGAISALGREATSAINSAYLRKVAEQNRASQAEASRMDREARAAQQAEMAKYRQDMLTLSRERETRLAQPSAPAPRPPIYSDSRGGFINADGTFTPIQGLPALPTPPSQRTREQERAEEAVTEEAEGLVWLDSQKKNPQVAAALGMVYRVNPDLAKSPGRAAAIVRRTMGMDRAEAAPRPVARPTESQEKSYLYVGMMEQALPTINQLADRVRGDRISFALSPVVPGAIGNRSLNADEQQLINAARVFATGILRKESGAAITDAEVRDTFEKYIPLSGDSPQVKAQKLANRTAAFRLLNDLAVPAKTYYDAQRIGAPTGGAAPEDVDAALNSVLSGGRP